MSKCSGENKEKKTALNCQMYRNLGITYPYQEVNSDCRQDVRKRVHGEILGVAQRKGLWLARILRGQK